MTRKCDQWRNGIDARVARRRKQAAIGRTLYARRTDATHRVRLDYLHALRRNAERGRVSADEYLAAYRALVDGTPVDRQHELDLRSRDHA